MRRRDDERAALGHRAEALVCAHLEAQRYEIIDRNVRVGRKEIDVIARRGRTLAFVEVRARKTAAFLSPLETIDHAKAQRIRSAALEWLREKRARGFTIRFDAAAVTFDDPDGEIDYRANAF